MARALVIGEALVDVVVGPDGGARGRHPGGSPLNVAIGLSRLQHDATLLTRLADDADGRLVLEHLAGSRVGLAPGSLAAAATSRATARLDEDGVATYEFDLDWRLPESGDTLARTLDETGVPEVVHTGSIATVLPPGADSVEELLRGLGGRATVSYDPNARPSLMGTAQAALARAHRVVGMADVVKVSDEDLGWLRPGSDPIAVAEQWLDRGPALVVVTRGGAGADAVGGFGQVHVDTPATAVVDTVGAGDAFTAGLLDALDGQGLLGGGRRDRLREVGAQTVTDVLARAAQVAAVTCSRPGADPPWRHELPAPPEAP